MIFFQWGNSLDINDFILCELDKAVLLKRCVEVTPKGTLTLSDFDHIAFMRETISCYLRQALQQWQKGVNFLIYGKPGTGKTEFAALLTETLGVSAYTLSYMDSDGDLIAPSKRLELCRLSQTLLEHQSAVLIFDEIEDVFSSGLFEQSVAQSHKA